MSKNTLIIIDWDDTMFPTSWLTKNNININDVNNIINYQLLFTELDSILYSFLKKSLKCGKVVIITNASYGWIDNSSHLLPETRKLLNKDVSILSARDTYSNKVEMKKWKDYAFEKEILSHFSGNRDTHNIISIGDAEYEYKALISFLNWDKIIPKKRNLKTIRFMTGPNFYSLIDQLNVLSDSIENICKQSKHLDLKFESLNN